MRVRKLARLVAVVGVVGLIATACHGHPTTDTTNAGVERTTQWVNLPLTGIQPAVPGHVGVDITFHSNVEGQSTQFLADYAPCHNAGDTFFSACALSANPPPSYAFVYDFTPNAPELANGVFVSNDSSCNPGYTLCQTGSVHTGWADRTDNIYLEVYNDDPDQYYQVGDAKLSSGCCGYPSADGHGYYATSGSIGTLTLPALGNPSVGYANGSVTPEGANPVPLIEIDAFWWQNTPSATTSSGYPVTGFASTDDKTRDANGKIVSDTPVGFYRTGALYAGYYKFVIDLSGVDDNKKVVVLRDVPGDCNGPGGCAAVINLDLSQPCYGLTSFNQNDHQAFETTNDIDNVTRQC